jgi:uncharacterized membrane protein
MASEAAPAPAPRRGRRLAAIDGLRGLVVVFMILQHTLDAWVHEPERHGLLWLGLRHLGGLPAPGFMLLAGLSSALVASRERQRGMDAWARAWVGVKRGLYILGVGLTYRVAAFLMDGSHWDEWAIIFRVDILNCMGVSLAIVAVATALAGTPRRSNAVLLTMAAITFLVTPYVHGHQYTVVSEFVGAYVGGREPLVLFPLFPWFAFTAIGYAAGEYLAAELASSPAGESTGQTLDRAFRPLLAVGLCVFSGGIWLGWAPFHLYPPHDYWNASPIFMTMRTGIQFVLLGTYAWMWRDDRIGRGGEFLQLLGRHSLLVYLVHLEFVYGRAAVDLQRVLTLRETLERAGAMVVVFGVVSWLLEWWQSHSTEVFRWLLGWWQSHGAEIMRRTIPTAVRVRLSAFRRDRSRPVAGQLDAG